MQIRREKEQSDQLENTLCEGNVCKNWAINGYYSDPAIPLMQNRGEVISLGLYNNLDSDYTEVLKPVLCMDPDPEPDPDLYWIRI